MQEVKEDLNQLYLVPAVGGLWTWEQVQVLPLVMEFAEITADRFVLAGVAEISADQFSLAGVAEISAGRFALAGVAIDFDLEEEWGLKRIPLIQFVLEHGR